MKVLFVGDVHAKPKDLTDCRVLIAHIEQIARQHEVGAICFMGDLHDTMALVRVEVTEFWLASLRKLSLSTKEIICLVGNHDMPGDSNETGHALLSYENLPYVTVVDQPSVLGPVLFVPYRHSNSEFVGICNEYSHIKTVVCHQEFNGATEGAFFSKHGVLPESIPQTLVIGGHIHAGQEFGKVWYPGNPRWLTSTDANQQKNLWVVDFDESGSVFSREKIPSMCRQIRSIVDSEDVPYSEGLEDGHNYQVEIVGSGLYIETRKPYWAGRAKIKTTRTDQATSKVKETEGIEVALAKYLREFSPKLGTPRAILEKMAHERLGT